MKNKRLTWIVIIVTIIVGSVFLFYVHNLNAKSTVFVKNGPIIINGFEYKTYPDISYCSPASISFSNIKIMRLRKNIYVKGNNTIGEFYSITANVKFNYGKKTVEFIFKGTSDNYPTTNVDIINYMLNNRSNKILLDGACYNPKNGKILNDYDFLVSPDFSFACIVKGNNKSGFVLNDFLQVINKKPFCIVEPCNSSDQFKFFFFENGVDFSTFKEAAKRGPIISYLKNRLGHIPTTSEIKQYVENGSLKP